MQSCYLMMMFRKPNKFSRVLQHMLKIMLSSVNTRNTPISVEHVVAESHDFFPETFEISRRVLVLLLPDCAIYFIQFIF